MNKVNAPCRPVASLKFTIDNILNLKTNGRSRDSCHPVGLQDDSATALERVGRQRQDPDSRLSESGKRIW